MTNINELNNWTVFQSDDGSVYRTIERQEADELTDKGLGSIVMVSRPGQPYLRRYAPTADYASDTIYWKMILSSWNRQRQDWREDYLRIEKIREEENEA